jgi:predicted Ser/Thr protein kinase/outer membrane biosynthesis protein TonB
MIGRVVKGKYKIYDEVGAGGFATVYLGRNMDTNEIVAIKVLGEQFIREARYVERFRREAGLAERLQHPNVVRILDHGIEDGMHFLVMEFVEGRTLESIIERKGRLPVEETVSYVEQACAGLQAAYQAGIVHRDIKPANLMITPDGTVKIMDFGIARMESMAGLTQSGMFMGTPRYISPEMAKGAGADIRSDLYALGLLTYEMLSGTPPFDADNPWAVLRQQIEVEPPPIRQIRSDVPQWLEAIIQRAIAKDPTQRFQTPVEMLAALREKTPTPSHVPQTILPRPAGATLAAKPKPRRGVSKGLIFGLAGTALVVALGVVAALVFGLGGGKATPVPTTTEAVVWAPTDTPTPLPTNTPVVIVITNTPEPTAIPTQPLPTDTSLPPTETPPEPTATETPTPTDTQAPPTKGPTKTPKPTAAPTSPPTVAAPAVAGRIAISIGGALHIFNAATGQDAVPPIANMHQPDFRNDGAEILADGLAGAFTSIVNINANTGAVVRNQTDFTNDFHPFWSPDGTRFAYDSLHHGKRNVGEMLYTQGLTGSNKREPDNKVQYNGQDILGTSPVWMQDDWIAFTGCDYWKDATSTGGSKCGIYRIPSWGDRPFMIRQGSTDMRATDNYGNQLLYMSQESGNWEVYIIPSQGGEGRNLSGSPNSNDGLGTFSPDGKMVAFVSNREGGWAVWAVKVDGTGLTKLFKLPAAPTAPWNDECMSWGP